MNRKVKLWVRRESTDLRLGGSQRRIYIMTRLEGGIEEYGYLYVLCSKKGVKQRDLQEIEWIKVFTVGIT